jgi:SAM-dependent methyltransferase
MNRENFDERAATWDNDEKTARASRTAACIARRVPLTANTRVFEYGCGTGLLSFALRPLVGAMTLADSSEGMLQVLRQKISGRGETNMQTVCLDLTVDPPPAERFDLICTLMSLHHVVPLEPVLLAFAGMLTPGGHLCVADLEKEDGSFHGEGFSGHHGFDRALFGNALADAGMRLEHWDICFDITRGSLENSRTFQVFLATAVHL